ncbi:MULTISPECIES: hypothetical protein [Pandoraea]|uniref:Uncharacterized protein n=2 Tax=Pandoraea TaxID=93217 RepID=A0A5E4XDL0_9BURK|nr:MULTISPECIES: hypothetical protein [Pandoraea]VVE16532.1 hypothetical protein PCE31107_02924 [Pandoraea cepalis]VVE34377.1 hypothetical protein PTE31013_03845 [Pandoraea terrigena]
MKSNEKAALTASLISGNLVWSVQMHPIYDAVAEVRLMGDGRYQIWHHYGEGSIAWADDIAAPTARLDQAIEIVKGYQKVFACNLGHAAAARAESINQSAGGMRMSLN